MDAACATVGHICKLKKKETHTHPASTRTLKYTWRILCQSHSSYSHLSKERGGGLVRDERDREEGEDAKKKKRSEKGEKEKDRGRRGSMCHQ